MRHDRWWASCGQNPTTRSICADHARVQAVWPTLWLLWLEALLLAPMVASYLHASKVQTAEELERDAPRARGARRRRRRIQKAAAQSAKAPAAANGHRAGCAAQRRSRLGAWRLVYLSRRHPWSPPGDGRWQRQRQDRDQQAAGLRCGQVYGWKVFYLDCKGDDDTAAQFQGAMQAAGRTAAMFPPAPTTAGAGMPLRCSIG